MRMLGVISTVAHAQKTKLSIIVSSKEEKLKVMGLQTMLFWPPWVCGLPVGLRTLVRKISTFTRPLSLSRQLSLKTSQFPVHYQDTQTRSQLKS